MLRSMTPGTETICIVKVECSEEHMNEDFKILAQHTKRIRTYSLTSGSSKYGERLLKFSKKFGIRIALGLGLRSDHQKNNREIAELIRLITDPEIPFDHVDLIIVGNETLFNKKLSPNELIQYIKRVNDFLAYSDAVNPQLVSARVTTCDALRDYTQEVADVVDVVMLNIHPLYAHKTPDSAIEWVNRKINKYNQLYDKEIIVGETGWPSGDDKPVATQENALKFLTNCSAYACNFPTLQEHQLYYFQLYDDLWKGSTESTKIHWGVYDHNKNFKY